MRSGSRPRSRRVLMVKRNRAAILRRVAAVFSTLCASFPNPLFPACRGGEEWQAAPVRWRDSNPQPPGSEARHLYPIKLLASSEGIVANGREMRPPAPAAAPASAFAYHDNTPAIMMIPPAITIISRPTPRPAVPQFAPPGAGRGELWPGPIPISRHASNIKPTASIIQMEVRPVSGQTGRQRRYSMGQSRAF